MAEKGLLEPVALGRTQRHLAEGRIADDKIKATELVGVSLQGVAARNEVSFPGDSGQGGDSGLLGAALRSQGAESFTSGLSRTMVLFPLSVKQGITIFATPSALEPDVLDKMCLASHSNSLQQFG